MASFDVKAYITGAKCLEPGGPVCHPGDAVFVGTDGQFYNPQTESPIAAPVKNTNIEFHVDKRGGTENIVLPAYLKSARIWLVADGESLVFSAHVDGGNLFMDMPSATTDATDPNHNRRFSFVEFDSNPDELYANLSFVDWVSLVLGISLKTKNGTEPQTIPGLMKDSVDNICKAVQELGGAWAGLCIKRAEDQQTLRILSPNLNNSLHQDFIPDYYDKYVNAVWERYINTQDDGNCHKVDKGHEVKCQVDVGTQNLTCDAGTPNQYLKPTTADIWGCDSGPFKIDGNDEISKEIVSRISASFVRSTLLLDGGDIQPSVGMAKYYNPGGDYPTNQYSRIVHEHLINGMGYAFAYDDVNPVGENAAGVLKSPDADTLTVYVGE
ncbi:uncharacterized protein BCR38DRAFT_352127 [Pseudomassariella vexata]|uniref:GH64 domain-containing protein n=1 Tax=Pseudomassariella vexata TaxID=1141098 RepID=A0A1Y2DIQ8_9PEZI|nr:uncharacterized protein BCR38DRAFT_352127 [Pseudomassariella vexata]ORY59128.1 hypothetical protein BCR38DRAFT_352127 [Pseudomassariella vexata]